jgi:hypothetical protein
LKQEIERELNQIQKTITAYISKNTRGDFKKQERFIDDITMVHREGIIYYSDYKQLMLFFTKKDWHIQQSDEWYSLNHQLNGLRANIELSIALAEL